MPQKQLVDKLKAGVFPGTQFECTDNGWINQELYHRWFIFFLANLLTQPVLLIEGGHSSHASREVVKLAQDNGVQFLCLSAHTTHVDQPLGVGIFKPLKSNLSKACTAYLVSHPGQVLTSEVLASLLCASVPKLA